MTGRVRLPSDRDVVIEKVHRGEMTPAAAEELAARLKWEPFAARSDPAKFDPMSLSEWSLPMAVAWIVRRTADAVREQWDDYRIGFREWRPDEWRLGLETPYFSGHALQTRPPASIARLEAEEETLAEGADNPIAFMGVADAIRELFEVLEAGMTRATFEAARDGVRQDVPEGMWRRARVGNLNGREVIEILEEGALSAHFHFGVRFKTFAITRIWPWPYEVPAAPQLPDGLRPDKMGYMPLFCAALWIATKGQMIHFDPTDPANWRGAYAELLDRIAVGDVGVVGLKDGSREPVPRYQFVGCKVDYPYCEAPFDLILGEEVYLCSFPNFGEEDWKAGFDDSLRDRRTEYWKRLMVANADVLRWWPFQLNERSAGPLLTGAPGRPTSMSLVRAEYDRRCDAGCADRVLSQEAKALQAWLTREHPTAPALTAKTIGNNLRDVHRRRFPS